MLKKILFVAILVGPFSVFAHENDFETNSKLMSGIFNEETDDLEFQAQTFVRSLQCAKASSSQINEVNKGNQLASQFYQGCVSATGSTKWCGQVMRPNPDSYSIFKCTYGANQPHQLIPPFTSSWKNASQAIKLIKELEAAGMKVCSIYNWWRPEPYNANVGGAAGRHPFGTSVDVRFCSMSDMERGFKQLCKWRAQGRLRALGYYGSTALHFGIGDSAGNTWGKSCAN